MCLQWKVYFSGAPVPDEVWFIRMAQDFAAHCRQEGWLSYIFSQQNDLGYGALYWIGSAWAAGLAGAERAGETLMLMRGAAFACCLLIPLLILVRGWVRGSACTLPALLVWFIFPAAWWSGKIVGPDMFSLGLGVAGVFTVTCRLTRSKRARVLFLAGWLLLGVALGIKVTAIPFIVFAVVWNMTYDRRPLKAMLPAAVFLLLGFFAANPFAVCRWPDFLSHLKSVSAAAAPGFSRIRTVFFARDYAWDLVFIGSLTAWGLTLAGFAVYASWLVYIEVAWGVFLAFALMLLTMTAMLFVSGTCFGWYCFPVIAVLPFMAFEGRRVLSVKAGVVWGAALLLFSLPNIKQTIFLYTLKTEQINVFKRHGETQTALTRHLAQWRVRFEHVFDMGDPGQTFEIPFFFYKEKMSGYDAVARWFEEGELPLSPQGAMLMILGDRWARVAPVEKGFDYQSLQRQLRDGKVSRQGKFFRVAHQETCGFLTLYVLVRDQSGELMPI
ncbi:MAG: glycosyltransferase family 87 protein [Candidatus Omnitrophota bacterium]